MRHGTNPRNKDRDNAVLTIYLVTDIVNPHNRERERERGEYFISSIGLLATKVKSVSEKNGMILLSNKLAYSRLYDLKFYVYVSE